MIGRLPRTLEIKGKEYRIRTDFRDILCIIAAFADDELKDEEKVYICLKKMYPDFEQLPSEDYADAYNAALRFIECEQSQSSKKKSPKIVDWEKDEQMIFPAINKVAGCEVRLLDYLHWYTFMGYFQSIDREDTYGYVLMLRQKKAKGKKLEKWENEFWNNNRDLCVINANAADSAKKAQDALQEIYESLLKGG